MQTLHRLGDAEANMLIVFKLIFGYLGIKLAPYFGTTIVAGLVSGIIIGHLVDHFAYIKFMKWRVTRAVTKKIKAEFDEQFLRSLFLMLGKLCIVDGAIAPEEIKNVDYVMSNILNLDRKSRAKAVAIFRSVRTNDTPFQTHAFKFFELYQNYPQMLDTTLQILFSVAVADGSLDQREEQLIHTAACVFGIDGDRYQRYKAPYVSNGQPIKDIDRCYSVLGCKKTDTNAEIKKHYRKLVAEYHPDKIISKELPEEFIKFAHEKFKSIQEAYEMVKLERGFN